MTQRRSGRPRHVDEGQDLVSLDECLTRAKEFLKMDHPPFTRRTLQNKISKGEYERYGTYHEPLVDWDEVKRHLHWRRRVS